MGTGRVNLDAGLPNLLNNCGSVFDRKVEGEILCGGRAGARSFLEGCVVEFFELKGSAVKEFVDCEYLDAREGASEGGSIVASVRGFTEHGLRRGRERDKDSKLSSLPLHGAAEVTNHGHVHVSGLDGEKHLAGAP